MQDSVIDQWVLLRIVMSAQGTITAKHWTTGFDRVNLRPSTRRSVGQWLGEINQHLVTAGGTNRTDIAPYGPRYLTLIKVPPVYLALEPSEQRSLKDAVAPPFDWTLEAMNALPSRTHRHITTGNAKVLMKFFNCMDKAVKHKLAKTSDLTPSAAIKRINYIPPAPPTKQQQIKQNQQRLAGVGHGSLSDRPPGLTGTALLDHSLRFYRRTSKPGDHLLPSPKQ